MRAILIEQQDLSSGEVIWVEGEMFDHLVKSSRVRIGESIKILNGKGLIGIGEVSKINRRTVKIHVDECSHINKSGLIDLAVGITKKEAYELTLKECVELGINRVIPINSEYSNRVSLKDDRIKRIIESGLLQSNNPWLLHVENKVSFDDLLDECSKYDRVIYLSSTIEHKQKININGEKILMVVGPEGGFSPEEEQKLNSLNNSTVVHLPTYLLRTPTAVACGIGFISAGRLF